MTDDRGLTDPVPSDEEPEEEHTEITIEPGEKVTIAAEPVEE